MAHQSVPAAARVLIVEDDAVFRLPLRATLAAVGYTVIAVDSAEAAEQRGVIALLLATPTRASAQDWEGGPAPLGSCPRPAGSAAG
jgi:hypothetical protein